MKFLGSGCWEGIPGQFCDDKLSKNVEWGSKDFRFRTSLYVETKNQKKIIFEITPDIRLQAWRFQVGIPDYFIVSHWHWDHLFGIRDLDWFFEKYSPIVYGNRVSYSWYNDEMSYIPVDFRIFNTGDEIRIDNLVIIPIRVYHTDDEEDTHGFIIKDNDTEESFVYMSDFNGIPEQTIQQVNNSSIVVLDGTFIDGKIEGDDTHCSYQELKDLVKRINTREFILTNISGFSEKTHQQLEDEYREFTIAYDGLEKKF